jgi:hypothetical protein
VAGTADNPLLQPGQTFQGQPLFPARTVTNQGDLAGGIPDGPAEPATGFTGGTTAPAAPSGVFQVLGPDGLPTGGLVRPDPSTGQTFLQPGETLGPQLGTDTPSTGVNPATGQPAAGGGGVPVTAGGDTGGTLGAGQPGFLPPAQTGGPAALGIVPGLAAGITGWINSIETAVGTAFKNAFAATFGAIQNWFARAFLILLAIVLIGIALWAMLSKTEMVKNLRKSAVVAA